MRRALAQGWEKSARVSHGIPIFRFQDGHNENLWGLRWLFRKNRNEDMIVRVHVLVRVGKGQSWFYLNKIVYVTVMFTVC